MEFFIILLVAVVIFGFKSFVVSPQQEVHAVERLGRFHRALTVRNVSTALFITACSSISKTPAKSVDIY